jgi:nitronate monooxygenase
LTDKPFALNLWVNAPEEPEVSDERFQRALERLRPYYVQLGISPPERPKRFSQDYLAQVQAALAAKPSVLSFVFGKPSEDLLRQCRDRGIFTIATATTVDEAIELEKCGIDAIVATGFEAGGHRPSFLLSPERSLTGTLALLPQVVNAVNVPVIAAGGIADARGVVAALALGAEAVQIGTAFLACKESGAPELHRQALLNSKKSETTLTRVFSGLLVRALRNRYVEEMGKDAEELLPYPAQNWLSGTLRAAAVKHGKDEFLSLQAGQSMSLARDESALELIERLSIEVPSIIVKLARHAPLTGMKSG